jgi:hypothetical protein
MKRQHRAIALIVAGFLSAIALTAAFANSNNASLAGSQLAAIASPTPPAKDAAGRIVGTCNTTDTCKAMKEACESLKEHKFKATQKDGSLGTCTEYKPRGTFNFKINPEPTSGPATDTELVAPKKTEHATIYCNGVSMCRKVKNICAVLGGTYTGTSGHSGSCQVD